jgi:hypothetical protein
MPSFEIISLLLFLLGLILGVGWIVKNKSEMPWALAVWNVVALLPILCSPLVFYVSIFVFDNPGPHIITSILVHLAMNSYSIFLILGCICSGICWKKGYKICAWLIPIISIVVIYGFILMMVFR